MSKMLQNNNGDVSSKRIVGVSLSGLGGTLATVLFFMSIFKSITDPETALDVVKLLLYSGIGVLLGSVAEYFAKGKK
jgi:hypothetical protein